MSKGDVIEILLYVVGCVSAYTWGYYSGSLEVLKQWDEWVEKHLPKHKDGGEE